MEAKRLVVAGIRMRWLEEGEGIPVVLVHGIPTSPELWRHVLPRLQGARALAWEMVGYGGSIAEGRGRDISVGRQAEYLVAWLRAMGIHRAILGGHDLGGGVAHIAATRHPRLCAGLLLTNSVGYDSWPIPTVKVLRSIGGVLSRAPAAAIRAGIGLLLRLGHDDPQVAADSLPVHWGHYAAADDAADAFVRQIRSLDVNDTLAVQHQLPSLDVPARVVWGEADFFQKVHYGERFARDLGVPLERIPGARHFTPEDHPDRIAGAVNELVREVEEAERGDRSRRAG